MSKRGAATAFGGSPSSSASKAAAAAEINWALGVHQVSFRRKGRTLFIRSADKLLTYAISYFSGVNATKHATTGLWGVTISFIGDSEHVSGLSRDEAEALVEHVLTLCDRI